MTDADASHSGESRSLNSGHRIFHNDASFRRCSNPRSSHQKDLRIGFAMVDILGRDDTLKETGRAECFQHNVNVRPRGCRRDGLQLTLFVEAANPHCSAGQRQDPFLSHQITVELFLRFSDLYNAL